MDMPVNVPVDNPNADTEWNDILRKHGVIPEKPPSPTPAIEEALTEARRLAHEHRLEGKDLDELDELEDDEEEEVLARYRQERMREMAAQQQAGVHGQVYAVQKPEYAREVTEASQAGFVFVLLTSSTGADVESRSMVELWRRLAVKYGELKFCQMRADLCIEGYPDRNTPTVLVYKDGEIKRQIVTLRELRGPQTDVEDVEAVLLALGAVRHSDLRLRRKGDENETTTKTNGGIRQGGAVRGGDDDDDDDSDWD